MIKHLGNAVPVSSSLVPQNRFTSHKTSVGFPELGVQSGEQVFNHWKFESEKGYESLL